MLHFFKEMVENFRFSRQELGKVSTLTMSSLMIALSLVLTYFTIVPNEFIKIGFSSLPIALVGMLYGPVVGGLVAGVKDLIGYLLRPTGPFFPGFTFNEILAGVFYGMFLYRRKVSLGNVILAKVSVTLIVNLFFASLWITVLYGKALAVILPMRIIKNVIMFPIEVMLLFVLVKFFSNIKRLKK